MSTTRANVALQRVENHAAQSAKNIIIPVSPAFAGGRMRTDDTTTGEILWVLFKILYLIIFVWTSGYYTERRRRATTTTWLCMIILLPSLLLTITLYYILYIHAYTMVMAKVRIITSRSHKPGRKARYSLPDSNSIAVTWSTLTALIWQF